tara:strand:- start:488 stop:1081 length:594 start_codon:yes stop_codon:yes gene_type:complete
VIITDKDKLTEKCIDCESIEEGEEIAVKLLDELKESKGGIGLAANQIGINKRVCVVNVKEPIVLINPTIKNISSEMFAFMEGCLSFPGDAVRTMRYKEIEVKAENHKKVLKFKVPKDKNSKDFLLTSYEVACVQHEIDHLDGITMFEREYKQQPYKRQINKIGRNDKVVIKKGKETQTIKYKKFDKLSEDGWSLVEV